jgi:hypothetical protein
MPVLLEVVSMASQSRPMVSAHRAVEMAKEREGLGGNEQVYEKPSVRSEIRGSCPESSSINTFGHKLYTQAAATIA